MKCPQHHGPIDNGLRIEPGHHTGGGYGFPYGIRCFGAVELLRFCPEQPDVDVDHNEAPNTQDHHLQPLVTLHHRADSKEAGKGQRHIKENDDPSGKQGTAACVGQRGVYHKQVFQTNGSHIGKPHGQSLKKYSIVVPAYRFIWKGPGLYPGPNSYGSYI